LQTNAAADNYTYRRMQIDGEWHGCYHWRVFGQVQKDLMELDYRRKQVETLHKIVSNADATILYQDDIIISINSKNAKLEKQVKVYRTAAFVLCFVSLFCVVYSLK
jgi:hypothetical protein